MEGKWEQSESDCGLINMTAVPVVETIQGAVILSSGSFAGFDVANESSAGSALPLREELTFPSGPAELSSSDGSSGVSFMEHCS